MQERRRIASNKHALQKENSETSETIGRDWIAKKLGRKRPDVKQKLNKINTQHSSMFLTRLKRKPLPLHHRYFPPELLRCAFVFQFSPEQFVCCNSVFQLPQRATSLYRILGVFGPVPLLKLHQKLRTRNPPASRVRIRRK